MANFHDRLAGVLGIPLLNIRRPGIFDALDIFILAVLVYLTLRWVRRTQAWVLFKGVLVIAFVWAVAQVLNLVTISYLLSSIFAAGPIIIVILFSSELRRVLEQIGNKGDHIITFNKNNHAHKAHTSVFTVGEIIKAAKQMSSTLTGALIVVEQDVDITEHEREGIPLDSLVSSQMLLSIFEKNMPMHDGAVIVRNNRIAAAKCYLPPAKTALAQELGTRHKAAVGVTEVSDARVVIVSEETGVISVAIEGELIRDVNELQLKELLLRGAPKGKSRFSFFNKRKGR